LLSRELLTTCFTGLFQMLGFGTTIALLSRFVENELGGGGVAVGVTLGSFSVSAILLRPWLGQIGDRRGRRVLIIIGGVLVGSGTAAHVIANSVAALVAGRLVIGAGQAAFFVGAATLVVDLAPADRRGEATSYFSVAIFLGSGIGPFLGQAMLDHYGFDAAFLLGAALSGSSAVVALWLPKRVPQTSERPVRIDQPARGGPPGLYIKSIPPGLTMFLGLMSFTAFTGFLPLRAEELGIEDIARFFLLQAVVVIVIRLVGATIPDRLGPVRTGTIALTSGVVGMSLMGLAGGTVGLMVATAVWSIGVSMLYPAMLIAALAGVPDDERASAMGTFTLFFDLAGGLGGLLLGVAKATSGNQAPFFVAASAAFIGLVAVRTWVASTVSSPTSPIAH
jgi:MFS family permease